MQAIREAGVRLIYEHGYEGMNLRQLADAVGIQAGSLYNHIHTKQDLLFELVSWAARCPDLAAFAAKLFNKRTGLDLIEVPYRSAGQMTQDVASGLNQVMVSSPAAANAVANRSGITPSPPDTRPAGSLPGQRAMHGTRNPPSITVPLAPAKGVCPPSGQVKFSAPLSVLNTRSVSFSRPFSFR